MPISMFGFQSALEICSGIMHLIQLGHACMYMPDAILNLEEHQGHVLFLTEPFSVSDTQFRIS